ncbi:hypothetical protein F7725_005713, partial [Dissostichus mawsoni]
MNGMLFPSTGKEKALLSLISFDFARDSVLQRIITPLQFDETRLWSCKAFLGFLFQHSAQTVHGKRHSKMFDRRKMLLASIVFTALFYKVTAESKKRLDMAPDAIDDMYNGCRKEGLEKLVHSGLLKQELNSSAGFQKAWSANSPCSKPIPGGTKEHMAAILAYVEGDAYFSKTFDNAVQTMGGNFHYKSLHFLLMDSMLLLHPKECKTVHIIREKYTAQQGSSLMKSMMDFEGMVVFNITSCFFINLGTNICSADKDMALLSPVEVFTVDAAKEIHDKDNDSEYTAIVLKHSSLKGTHDCYFLSRVESETGALLFAEDAGVHPREGAHGALATRSKSCVSELQLIVARNVDKGTPAESPLEAGPKPAPKSPRHTLVETRHHEVDVIGQPAEGKGHDYDDHHLYHLEEEGGKLL